MKQRLKGLPGLSGTDTLVEIDRKPLDPHLLRGFVVAVSDSLLLLHEVDGSTLTLNGYAAIRLTDIRSFSVDESFVPRALRLLGRKPNAPPEIDIFDWCSLFRSVSQKYPLMMVECEKSSPGCGFVGSVVSVDRREVRLLEVDTNGEYDGIGCYRLKGITQVSFDDGYTSALAIVASGPSSASAQ